MYDKEFLNTIFFDLYMQDDFIHVSNLTKLIQFKTTFYAGTSL